MGKKIAFILLVLFQFQFLQARNLPGHTGGGHLIDGQLLDFYFSEKTTKFTPEELPQYKDVEEKLWPLIKILPGYGFHLLRFFKDIDWYFTKENIKCADPDTNSMIYLDTQATAFACQNNVEVIINENLFYSLSPENQTYGLIHELLRAHQKNNRTSMPDTSIFRLLKIIKDLNINPNLYSYNDLVKRLYRLNVLANNHNHNNFLTNKADFTELLLDQLRIVNSTIDILYSKGTEHPKEINIESIFKLSSKLLDDKAYDFQHPSPANIAFNSYKHLIKNKKFIALEDVLYDISINLLFSRNPFKDPQEILNENKKKFINQYQKFFDELTYDELRQGKETIEDTLVRLL